MPGHNASLLRPDDLLEAASMCREALTPALDADWSVPAGDLEWDCRRTLDHVADALVFYSTQLASRAQSRLPKVRDRNPDLPLDELLQVVQASAAILAQIVRATPDGARAFHPAGMADASGFVGMGCTEILIHTDDICRGLGRDFRPSDDIPRRVLNRIFPWAPDDGDAWETLRWAAGRQSSLAQERLGADWYWQCAPLEEWDGKRVRRTLPPGWR